MEKLIPYSVHLPEDIYLQLKAAAGERRGSALIREALTSYLSGGSELEAGYTKGINDCIKVILKDPLLSGLSIKNKAMDLHLASQLQSLHRKSNGKKKRGD
jgi:hypothetical protein